MIARILCAFNISAMLITRLVVQIVALKVDPPLKIDRHKLTPRLVNLRHGGSRNQ